MSAIEFSCTKPERLEYQTAEAWDVATDMLGDSGRPLTLVNDKTPVWVFLDGQEDAEANTAPTVALRLSKASDPDQSLKHAQNNATLTEQLRAKGARVLETVREPSLERDTYVATMSRYIGKETVRDCVYGKSIATLHNAGEKVGVASDTVFFNPLWDLGNTVDFLRSEQDECGGYAVGDTVFPQQLLERLEYYMAESQLTLQAIHTYMQIRGYPYVGLQEDVQPDNARGKLGTLIDLDDILIGPAEYDLGRPHTQWARWRKDGNVATMSFEAGYRQNVTRQPDPILQRMTDKISLLKFSTAHLTLSTTQLFAGKKPSEWLLQEGIRRLQGISNPRQTWERLDLGKKAILAAEQVDSQ